MSMYEGTPFMVWCLELGCCGRYEDEEQAVERAKELAVDQGEVYLYKLTKVATRTVVVASREPEVAKPIRLKRYPATGSCRYCATCSSYETEENCNKCGPGVSAWESAQRGPMAPEEPASRWHYTCKHYDNLDRSANPICEACTKGFNGTYTHWEPCE